MSNEEKPRSADDRNGSGEGADKESSMKPTRDQTAVLVDLAAKHSRSNKAAPVNDAS
jgi:hypothetical protein